MASVENAQLDISTNSSTATTPTRSTIDGGADNKKTKVVKRKRSATQESATNGLTPKIKQQKLLTDQQQQQALLTAKEMETEALMATQSILDNDDSTTDFFVESSSIHSTLVDIPMVESKIQSDISYDTIIETSGEENAPQTKIMDKSPALLIRKRSGEGLKSQLTFNASTTTTTSLINTASFVTIPATTKKQHAASTKLNTKGANDVGNILQGATAKQTNLPSVFFKSNKTPTTGTSPNFSSMANFIIKTNATAASTVTDSPNSLAITNTMKNNTLQQQLAISNAILLQHQQQQKQQQQQAVRPQFFISTKSGQGKPAVVSLQQIVNKNPRPAKSPKDSQGKSTAPLVNNVKQHLLSGKPLQASKLGLTLGNFTSASLQNINQMISAKKTQAIVNKQSKTRETIPAANLSMANSVLSGTINKSLHLPSKQNFTVVSTKANDSVRTVPSTASIQHANVSLVSVNKNHQNTKISFSSIKQSTVSKIVGSSISEISQPQVSGLKFVPAKTVASQQTPMQTLSLNQLMAAARTNLQTTTVRPGVSPPVVQIGATKIRPTNAASATTTLQALLQVVQKSTQGGGVASNAQLVIQPQQLTTGAAGSDLQKDVRLPSAALVAKSTVSPSNIVSGVTMQRQMSAGHPQSPVAGTPIRAVSNVVAPLKISLPRTAFSGGIATIRMSPNRVRSPSSRSPANIVFSSPNLVLSRQAGKTSFPKEQQSQEKK